MSSLASVDMSNERTERFFSGLIERMQAASSTSEALFLGLSMEVTSQLTTSGRTELCFGKPVAYRAPKGLGGILPGLITAEAGAAANAGSTSRGTSLWQGALGLPCEYRGKEGPC